MCSLFMRKQIQRSISMESPVSLLRRECPAFQHLRSWTNLEWGDPTHVNSSLKIVKSLVCASPLFYSLRFRIECDGRTREGSLCADDGTRLRTSCLVGRTPWANAGCLWYCVRIRPSERGLWHENRYLPVDAGKNGRYVHDAERQSGLPLFGSQGCRQRTCLQQGGLFVFGKITAESLPFTNLAVIAHIFTFYQFALSTLMQTSHGGKPEKMRPYGD